MTSGTANAPRTITAVPLPSGAVHTIIGPDPGPRGPWSFITDRPGAGRLLTAPPAPYLAVAAWAA